MIRWPLLPWWPGAIQGAGGGWTMPRIAPPYPVGRCCGSGVGAVWGRSWRLPWPPVWRWPRSAWARAWRTVERRPGHGPLL